MQNDSRAVTFIPLLKSGQFLGMATLIIGIERKAPAGNGFQNHNSFHCIEFKFISASFFHFPGIHFICLLKCSVAFLTVTFPTAFGSSVGTTSKLGLN